MQRNRVRGGGGAFLLHSLCCNTVSQTSKIKLHRLCNAHRCTNQNMPHKKKKYIKKKIIASGMYYFFST